MGRVSRNDQQKRLDDGLPCLSCIGLQLDLGVLVQPDAILQLDLLQLSRCELTGIENLLDHDGRLSDKAEDFRRELPRKAGAILWIAQ